MTRGLGPSDATAIFFLSARSGWKGSTLGWLARIAALSVDFYWPRLGSRGSREAEFPTRTCDLWCLAAPRTSLEARIRNTHHADRLHLRIGSRWSRLAGK